MNNNDRFIEDFKNVEITRGDQQYSDFLSANQSSSNELLKMATNKYLPIGSVIKLANSQNLYMIIGFNSLNTNGELKDYIGCCYPNGINENENLFLFNHDEIERINHVGFFNTHGKKYQSELNNS